MYMYGRSLFDISLVLSLLLAIVHIYHACFIPLQLLLLPMFSPHSKVRTVPLSERSIAPRDFCIASPIPLSSLPGKANEDHIHYIKQVSPVTGDTAATFSTYLILSNSTRRDAASEAAWAPFPSCARDRRYCVISVFHISFSEESRYPHSPLPTPSPPTRTYCPRYVGV